MKCLIEPVVRVLHDLPNETWFGFHRYFIKIVQQKTPAALGIETVFPEYVRLVDEADVTMDQMSKSFFTDDIQTANRALDECFRGLKLTVKGFVKKPETKKTAERLMLLFRAYGDVTKREYNAKNTTVYNFLQEVQAQGKLSEDVKLLGLTDWVDRLANYNNEFGSLIGKRHSEKAMKPDRKMVVVRRETDACYGRLIMTIESFAFINPAHGMDDFVRELNVAIKDYKTVFAQSKGRRNSKKKKLQEQKLQEQKLKENTQK